MRTTSTSRRSSSELCELGELTSQRRLTFPVSATRRANVVWSTRDDGDFNRADVPPSVLERRRRALVDLPWTMLAEHHGVAAVRVGSPGEHDGADGDVAFTSVSDAVLGCWVGDCAPIVLVGDDEVAVVHAGWRGLAAGIVDIAVGAMTTPPRSALLGPCISPCCYEFGADDLAAVAAGVGCAPTMLTSATRSGRLALDVPTAVTMALSRHGVVPRRLAGCTGCEFDGFSHRGRGERGRHVVAVWLSDANTGDGAA